VFRLRDNRSQKNTFFGRELRRAFVEIIGRGFLNTINQRSPFGYVQINFIHTFFRSQLFCLYQPYDERFFQFAGKVLVPVEKYVFYQLHGNCAASSGETFDLQVVNQSFTHRIRQKALVVEKSSVFTLHDRHPQQWRNAVQRSKMFP